jgi:Na+/melibiose symporter-like transporter
VIGGGEHGFSRFQSWGPALLGLVILAGFVAYERRIAYPSLDVRLFADPRFSASVGAVGLVFFAAMGTFFFVAFYLQLVRGYTPLQTGALMLPFAAAQLVFAPRSAALVKRFGPKAVSAAGLALVAVGLGGFGLIGTNTSMWYVGLLVFLQGAGMANVMPPATESIMSTLPREKAGVGSAVANTIRQVGGALGVAVLGSVLAAVYRDRIAASVSGLPKPVRDAASESISGAYGVADRLGPAAGDLIRAANETFVSAMHYAAWGSAVTAVLGVIVVLIWLPSRSVTDVPVPSPVETLGEQLELAAAER